MARREGARARRRLFVDVLEGRLLLSAAPLAVVVPLRADFQDHLFRGSRHALSSPADLDAQADGGFHDIGDTTTGRSTRLTNPTATASSSGPLGDLRDRGDAPIAPSVPALAASSAFLVALPTTSAFAASIDHPGQIALGVGGSDAVTLHKTLAVTPADAPLLPGAREDVGELETALAASTAAPAGEQASPRGSGLLADFVPLDGQALEGVFDRLFDDVYDLGTELASTGLPTDVYGEPFAWAAALAAFEIARRCLRRATTDERHARRPALWWAIRAARS